MPRKIKNKEINDMRRICEIMLTHPKEAHNRMWEFCIGHVKHQVINDALEKNCVGDGK